MKKWNCDPDSVSEGETAYSQNGSIGGLSADLIELFDTCSPYIKSMMFLEFTLE